MTNAQILARVDAIVREHNPCNIQMGKGEVTCRGEGPCCDGCTAENAKAKEKRLARRRG